DKLVGGSSIKAEITVTCHVYTSHAAYELEILNISVVALSIKKKLAAVVVATTPPRRLFISSSCKHRSWIC
ncbi:hypothetical protein ACA545_01190, partial [Vibrio cholerae]|uniref:hypothetical protein n=1 Tax=Vibrio cholerae TaxID=666 RepID=UPI003A0FDA99